MIFFLPFYEKINASNFCPRYFPHLVSFSSPTFLEKERLILKGAKKISIDGGSGG
jgi:hypothetical protein